MNETAAVHGPHSPSQLPPRTWADRARTLGLYAAAIVGAALFPRVAYWMRWPTRLGPRGRIAYAAFNALSLFAIRELMRRTMEKAEEWEQARDQLRRRLGREPTERELLEHFEISEEV